MLNFELEEFEMRVFTCEMDFSVKSLLFFLLKSLQQQKKMNFSLQTTFFGQFETWYEHHSNDEISKTRQE